MKKAFLILFSLYSVISFSQRINEYEFVIIPIKFQFQRSVNEYRLNALLKNRLEDFGFRAFYQAEQFNTNDIDPCSCLYVDVVNVSNIFLTKLQIEFKDCTNGIVHQSIIGTSEEKDRFESFNEALTMALKSLRNINYKFNGTKADLSHMEQVNKTNTILDKVEQPTTGNYNIEQAKIEKAKAELVMTLLKLQQAKSELEKIEQATVSQQSKANPVAMQKAKVKPSGSDPRKTAQNVVEQSKKEQTRIEATKSQPIHDETQIELEKAKQAKAAVTQVDVKQSIKDQKAAASEEGTSAKMEKTAVIGGSVLFATPIENGFQLIDETSKVVMVLIKTLQPDYFNANVDKKYGVVFKKNKQWVFEYYFEGKLIVEDLNIKF
jgi:hypothetical protein